MCDAASLTRVSDAHVKEIFFLPQFNVNVLILQELAEELEDMHEALTNVLSVLNIAMGT